MFAVHAHLREKNFSMDIALEMSLGCVRRIGQRGHRNRIKTIFFEILGHILKRERKKEKKRMGTGGIHRVKDLFLKIKMRGTWELKKERCWERRRE